MNELYLRTEDIDDSNILSLCIENTQDREIINLLKSRTPIILEGSRGVGKSFLMRVAAKELKDSFAKERILPVYITFIKSSLVAAHRKGVFLSWMLANICSKVIRQLKRNGIIVESNSSIDILAGGKYRSKEESTIEKIKRAYEESWNNVSEIDTSAIPTVENFKDAVEEICEDNGINRIVLFIDEAAHNFIRGQQAEFFTLFRDLRCPKVSCKAAVYPGVTAYGDIFQISQDASLIKLNRFVLVDGYVDFMKDLVFRQIEDSTYQKELSRKGQTFTDLTYAASGNPRFLLNNIREITKFTTSEVNQCIKAFYRDNILRDHTALSSKYPKLRELIDWGRNFIEDILLPDLQKRNQEALEDDKPTTAFFWINRDAPEPVKRAISLLEYSGIVIEINKGHKGTAREIGTRYMVNLGCLFAMEANPLTVSHQIIENLSIRKFIEYGANSPIYNDIKDNLAAIQDNDIEASLAEKISQNVCVLDLSAKMIEKLREIGLITVKDVLIASEDKIKEAYYVGDVRARTMKRAALTSVYEYLIG